MEPSMNSQRGRCSVDPNGNTNLMSSARMSQHSLRSNQMNPAHRASFDKLAQQYQRYDSHGGSLDSLQLKVDVLPQQVIPMINSLSEENAKLKEETQLIADELQGLQKVSQALLSENGLMHQHCSLRTLDLQKIVETISLNLGEDENDLKHSIYLYREQNNSMIKALNSLQKEVGMLDQKLGKGEALKAAMYSDTKETEFKIMEGTIRIKDLQSQIKSLQSTQRQLVSDRNSRNQRVDGYVIDNIETRTFNRDAVLQLKQESEQVGIQKPRVMTHNIQLHSNNLQLKKSVKGVEEQLSARQKHIDLLVRNLQKQRSENQQKQNSIQLNRSQLGGTQDKIRRLQKQIQESVMREKQLDVQLTKLVSSKQQVSRTLQTVDMDLKSKEAGWNQSLKEKRASKVSNIRNIRNMISKKTIAFSHEKATLEYSLKELKIQADYTRGQVEERQSQINELKSSGENVYELQREVDRLNKLIGQQELLLASGSPKK